MAELDRIRDARDSIRRAAVSRWADRAAVRAANEAKLLADGPGAADSPQRQARFVARSKAFDTARQLRAAGALPLGLERKIGPTLDYTPYAPSESARKAGRPVARLVRVGGPQTQPEGFATGFLCGQDLLLTNHHVFPDRSYASGTAANFLFERTDRGIQLGELFDLDPDRFFLSSEELDFALVAVEPKSRAGTALGGFGMVGLVEATPKILIGQPVNIIQHPDGGPKQYATTQNRLVDVLESGFLHYETDTLPGSSGAPAFSVSWELVALHHTAIPRVRDGRYLARDGSEWREGMDEDAVDWVANEGIRVSAIVKHLGGVLMPQPGQQSLLRSFLAMTTDPADEIQREAPGMGRGADMAGRLALPGTGQPPAVQFVFTGPVTVHVNAMQASGPAPPPPAMLPPAPAAPGAAEERSIQFDRRYDLREGYDPGFLGDGIAVPVPGVGDARRGELLNGGDGRPLVLKYHHFELAMNARRRLQMWSAVNVDYDPALKSKRSREEFGRDRWIPDPRIPETMQILDAEIYKPAGNIDRGHMVRREDNAWGGSEIEIEFANSDTFHWTNCTPQHEAFNQSSPGRNDAAYRGMKGLWGDFENHIQQSLGEGESRACILSGPVLADDDPEASFGGAPVQYPLRFWKVVAVPVRAGGKRALRAFGFVLSQKPVVTRFGIEEFGAGKFRRYQVALRTVEELSGVSFDRLLHDADAMAEAGGSIRIDALAQVRGIPGQAPADAAAAPPVA